MLKVLLGDEEWSNGMLVSAAMLPVLLSLDIKLSPVKRRVKGDDASEVPLLLELGEPFSKLSLDRDLGVGVDRPLRRGELRLALGVLRSSFNKGEAYS